MSRKTVTELLAHYRSTLEDGRFSRGEKRAIQSLLQNARFDERQLELLRHKLFNLAKSHTTGARAHDAFDWLEKAVKTLPAPAASNATSRVFFSPGETCLGAITSLIKAARNQLDICVFTITDDRITRRIMEVHRRGVDVRVITDNDKAFDPGSDIQRLANAGVPVRTDNTPDHMHHKFAIIDGNTVLTGSYNWTRSAAGENHENLLVTDDRAVVNPYMLEFGRLWPRMRRKV